MGHFPYFLCKSTQRTLQRAHFHCEADFVQHRSGSTSHPQSLHFGVRLKGPAPISQRPSCDDDNPLVAVGASSCDDDAKLVAVASSCDDDDTLVAVTIKGPARGSCDDDGTLVAVSSKGNDDDTLVAGARSIAGASCKAVRARDDAINSKVCCVYDNEELTLSAKTLCCGLCDGLTTLSVIVREGGVIKPPMDTIDIIGACFANIIAITA
jgi:hypothetical protein